MIYIVSSRSMMKVKIVHNNKKYRLEVVHNTSLSGDSIEIVDMVSYSIYHTSNGTYINMIDHAGRYSYTYITEYYR